MTGLFDEADKNGDGVLSREEFEFLKQNPHAKSVIDVSLP